MLMYCASALFQLGEKRRRIDEAGLSPPTKVVFEFNSSLASTNTFLKCEKVFSLKQKSSMNHTGAVNAIRNASKTTKTVIRALKMVF